MKHLLLLFFLYSTFNFNWAMFLPYSVEEYYWRDFTGLVPSDAVPGGKNADGEVTYIGQMNIPAEYNIDSSKIHTIPVTITNRNRIAVGAYNGKAVKSNENSYVKVLCTQYMGSMTWHSQKELVNQGCRYVIAGLEDTYPMFVGKADHNKETIIGKVFSGGEHYSGLIIPYDDAEFLPSSYKVLMTC